MPGSIPVYENSKAHLRVRRKLQTVMAGLLLLAGVCAGTGTAHATGTISPIAHGNFKLRATYDFTSQVAAGLAANTRLSPVSLSSLAGTGAAGKVGLCYPEPFHPGVRAEGYCWNNVDDTGSGGWNPQGLSVPHGTTADSDGWYQSRRWEVVSWSAGSSQAKLRFVDRGATGDPAATPRYFDVRLVTVSANGAMTNMASHNDSVVWYGKHLLVGTGGILQFFHLDNLQRDLDRASGYDYVLPLTLQYRTTEQISQICSVLNNNTCMSSLSFDRQNSALVSGEFRGNRMVRWPFDLSTGLPDSDGGAIFGDTTASGAWYTPVNQMQGALFAQGKFFMSGSCPSGYNNGYRENSCIYKAGSGEAPYVLTSAPDMTQNLDWDSSAAGGQGRIRGVNEVGRADKEHSQRLVFSIKSTADQIETFRLKNVNSGKCLVPYSAGLDNNATVVQWDCSGTNAQDWYWNGSEIRNFQSKRCLSVKDGSSSNGAVLEQFECRGYRAQYWYTAPGSAGGALLVNHGSGLCATINGGSAAHDAHAVQWACNSTHPAHAWIGTGK
ncbi:RICIN domain-containing protein [Streptomyces cinereoruber]|uniref:RICIN domain-containing protein n=1 Tax=Streptomyces cinereoruber TaxID=67260 RepID=UPI00362BC2A1